MIRIGRTMHQVCQYLVDHEGQTRYEVAKTLGGPTDYPQIYEVLRRATRSGLVRLDACCRHHHPLDTFPDRTEVVYARHDVLHAREPVRCHLTTVGAAVAAVEFGDIHPAWKWVRP